jgi:hypothetical protein
MRHLPSCNLFFRSARGCFRQNCSHSHLETQAFTALLASKIAAGDDVRFVELNQKLIAQEIQSSELHEKLSAQEVLMKNLLASFSKLGCKLGNFEASFHRHLETQNTKLSGEIGCLNVQVQRNRKTSEELKLPSIEVIKELVTIKTKISELNTELINTKQKFDHLSVNPEESTKIEDRISEIESTQYHDKKEFHKAFETIENKQSLIRIQLNHCANKNQLKDITENLNKVDRLSENQSLVVMSLQNRLGKLEGKLHFLYLSTCLFSVLADRKSAENNLLKYATIFHDNSTNSKVN